MQIDRHGYEAASASVCLHEAKAFKAEASASASASASLFQCLAFVYQWA